MHNSQLKLKIVAIFVVHEPTGMCNQDGVVYSCRLTGNHNKTEIKKILNHTVVRKGMLDRRPTISGGKLKYAEFHVVQCS